MPARSAEIHADKMLWESPDRILIIGLDFLRPVEERSAGAVVFRDSPGGRSYILLQNAGRWDFPKGGIEKGESELQTVRREVSEETGITELEIIPGFRKVIEYFYRRDGKNIHKQVVYMLARTTQDKVKISWEHQGFGWFSYPQALEKASYGNSKVTLTDAEEFLKGSTIKTV
jgi:bis(5'-nucleosidyl)-tetraphosphatase